MKDNKPAFHVRAAGSKELVSISAKDALSADWHHLAAVLGPENKMTLYVDGQQVAEGVAKG